MAAEEDVFCPRCAYNLHGIPEHRCPECGFGFDRPAVRDLADEYVRVCLATYRRLIRLSAVTVASVLLPYALCSLPFQSWLLVVVYVVMVAVVFVATVRSSEAKEWPLSVESFWLVCVLMLSRWVGSVPWLAAVPFVMSVVELLLLPRRLPHLGRTAPEEVRSRLATTQFGAFAGLGLSVLVFVVALL